MWSDSSSSLIVSPVFLGTVSLHKVLTRDVHILCRILLVCPAHSTLPCSHVFNQVYDRCRLFYPDVCFLSQHMVFTNFFLSLRLVVNNNSSIKTDTVVCKLQCRRTCLSVRLDVHSSETILVLLVAATQTHFLEEQIMANLIGRLRFVYVS